MSDRALLLQSPVPLVGDGSSSLRYDGSAPLRSDTSPPLRFDSDAPPGVSPPTGAVDLNPTPSLDIPVPNLRDLGGESGPVQRRRHDAITEYAALESLGFLVARRNLLPHGAAVELLRLAGKELGGATARRDPLELRDIELLDRMTSARAAPGFAREDGVGLSDTLVDEFVRATLLAQLGIGSFPSSKQLARQLLADSSSASPDEASALIELMIRRTGPLTGSDVAAFYDAVIRGNARGRLATAAGESENGVIRRGSPIDVFALTSSDPRTVSEAEALIDRLSPPQDTRRTTKDRLEIALTLLGVGGARLTPATSGSNLQTVRWELSYSHVSNPGWAQS